jgi:hypothetical protein
LELSQNNSNWFSNATFITNESKTYSLEYERQNKLPNF